MITVHHLNNSRSQRVLWLLEELALPYEIVRYERDPKTLLAPASLLAVHPLGKSPVISDGGATIAESGAILEYLVDTYGKGKLRPAAGSPESLQYRYFMHYAEGSLMPPLFLKFLFDRLPGRVPFPLRWAAKGIAQGVLKSFVMPRARQHVAFMEGELAGREWFAGRDLTAADIQLSYPVEAVAARIGLDGQPNLRAWLDRCHARPAYKRAIERNGPFEIPK